MNTQLVLALVDTIRAQGYAGASHTPFALKHPERAPKVPSGRPFESTGNARLDTILRRLKPEIRYGGDPATANAGEYIVMPHAREFERPQDYRAILLHELSHWTAGNGVAREPTGYTTLHWVLGFIPDGYANEEMVAEFAAAMALDALGEDPELDKRAKYIGNWCRTLDDDARAEALRRAAYLGGKIAEFLVAHSTPEGTRNDPS